MNIGRLAAAFGSGLGGFGWPAWNFDTELLSVLRVQPLPAAELLRLQTSDTADGSSAEKAIQNVETKCATRQHPLK